MGGARLTLTRLARNPLDIALLRQVLEAAPVYHERITGAPAGPDEARTELALLPHGVERRDTFTFTLIICTRSDCAAGMLRNYPAPGTSYLGLLLIRQNRRGRGLGRTAYERLDREAVGRECDVMRLVVVDANAPAQPFWRRMGFALTGEVRPYKHSAVRPVSRIMEKRVG